MRVILIIKSIINLLIGIIVIALRESILDYLSYVIAGALLIESVEELIYVVIKKKFIESKDALFSPLSITFIAIVLIIENIVSNSATANVEFVCIIWGTVSIYAACKDVSKGIHEYKNAHKLLIHLGKGAIELTFAMLLLLDPLEHVMFHIIVLGIEFILEAIDISLHWIRYKTPKHIHFDEKALVEIERIQEYVKENPTMEEEILETIKENIHKSKE